MLYYELCERVWSGSRATEQIESRVESSDIGHSIQSSTLSTAVSADTSGDEEEESGGVATALEQGESVEPTSATDTAQHRRELLNKTLKKTFTRRN